MSKPKSVSFSLEAQRDRDRAAAADDSDEDSAPRTRLLRPVTPATATPPQQLPSEVTTVSSDKGNGNEDEEEDTTNSTNNPPSEPPAVVGTTQNKSAENLQEKNNISATTANNNGDSSSSTTTVGTPSSAASPAAAAAAAPSRPRTALKSGRTPNTTHPTESNGAVYCSDCKSYISLEEWPNHRDRLRPVEKTKQQLNFFQRYLTTLFVDFVMWVLVNVYFREVAVVGLENVPKEGPVVFYGNHQNQFIDAMMIRAHCGRPVRFIIAEKSMHRPVIGQFARMMEAVPVVRPQDVPSVVGQGRLKEISGNVVYGEGTSFLSQLSPGDVLSWAVTGKKERCSGQVHLIASDTELSLTMKPVEADRFAQPTSYKCSRRIDHSEMYADVYNTLQKGDCIGIFPEGGSHDRTSLLPLKAGVALFSLGSYERGVRPAIIPCGLTYFYGHKFRSRAHIEFGKPIVPSAEMVTLFTTDKRKATGMLLENLAIALRSVTINVVDWDSLKILHGFRRLYQPADCILDTGAYLNLTRRLAVIMEEQEATPEFQDFRFKVDSYTDFCSALLVRDSQAATLEKLDGTQSATIPLLFRRLVILTVMLIVLIPFFIVAVPIGLIAGLAANHHAKTALSGSSVKVVAADVKGSYKIIVGFLLVPLEMFIVAVVVYQQTSELRTALTVLFSLPMAMYVSLLILQEANLEVRAATPLIMSLFSKHKQFKKLYAKRLKLVELAKELVRKYDPSLDVEVESYREDAASTSVREPSLFSLRHSARRLADSKNK